MKDSLKGLLLSFMFLAYFAIGALYMERIEFTLETHERAIFGLLTGISSFILAKGVLDD